MLGFLGVRSEKNHASSSQRFIILKTYVSIEVIRIWMHAQVTTISENRKKKKKKHIRRSGFWVFLGMSDSRIPKKFTAVTHFPVRLLRAAGDVELRVPESSSWKQSFSKFTSVYSLFVWIERASKIGTETSHKLCISGLKDCNFWQDLLSLFRDWSLDLLDLHHKGIQKLWNSTWGVLQLPSCLTVC